MTTLKQGDAAPDFCLPRDGGGTVGLQDFRGRKLVLYFYPKDDTSGCTAQSCSFSENIKAFEHIGCAVVGVSKDSVKSHDKFKAKYNLQFPLASDEGGDTCERYSVWTEKSMMGRKYMGIARTTFLIDETGMIEKIWCNVKVEGHTDEIIEALKGKQSASKPRTLT